MEAQALGRAVSSEGNRLFIHILLPALVSCTPLCNTQTTDASALM